jgi:hypothetical protein
MASGPFLNTRHSSTSMISLDPFIGVRWDTNVMPGTKVVRCNVLPAASKNASLIPTQVESTSLEITGVVRILLRPKFVISKNLLRIIFTCKPKFFEKKCEVKLGVVVVVAGGQLFYVALVTDFVEAVTNDFSDLQRLVGGALPDQLGQNFALESDIRHGLD